MKKQTQSVRRKLVTTVALMAAIGMAVIPAHAVSTATTTMAVSATITATCTIAATALSFGAYTQAAASSSTSTLTVTCTDLSAYTVGLDGGGAGATATQRYMTGATNTTAHLNYNLYSNAGNTTVWGNTTANEVSGTGTGTAQTLTVYGQIPSGQNLPADSYSDTVNAYVYY